MSRAAILLLRLVGLTLVLLGVMGFVLVGDGGTWTARGSVPAGRAAVLVEPAVASVLGAQVTVRVAAADGSGGRLFAGRGRADDLSAYAQDEAVTRVVALDGPRLDLVAGPAPAPALSADGVASTGTSSPPHAGWSGPATVDLWQQEVTGAGAVEMTWRPSPGARSILVAREDGSPLPALEIEVDWTNHRWLWFPALALV
ncbi:MAG TPA: hypothetical protein VFL94_10715, partial [Actinomycetales bacterium]|nr:hypothetical protein [Actinomycetales bacterium]